MWNDAFERKRLGTSIAHPFQAENQSVYTPSRCVGMLVIRTLHTFSSFPPWCVASNPCCFIISFTYLHASSQNSAFQRLMLQVSVLPTMSWDSGASSSLMMWLVFTENCSRIKGWSHRFAFAACIPPPEPPLPSSAPPHYCLALSSVEPIVAASLESHTSFLPSPPCCSDHLAFEMIITKHATQNLE